MEQNILLEEIIKRFDLYKKQQITYDELLNMYNEYSDKFNLREFANLLGVKSKTFADFKYNHKKIKIKKNKDKKLTILSNRNLTIEEENKKILELAQKYNLYKCKEISYNEFKEMHEEVKTVLTEIELANLLGITVSNLRNGRNPNTNYKFRIFRNCKLDKEATEKIRKQILKKYEGKKTYYESNENNKGEIDFLELYWPYRIYFSEKEFAELLGISEKNLWYAKNKKGNPKIKDIEKIKKIQLVRNELEKMTYLRKDEIEGLCQRLEISVEDFITYYINNGDFFDPSAYKQALDINNGLWTKKGSIEKNHIKDYNEIFSRISRTVATKIKKNYSEKFYNEDLQSNILLFILQNCRDLIKNFKYDAKLMEKMIWLRARQYAKVIYLLEQKENMKMVSFNDQIKNNNKSNNIEINDVEIKNIEIIENDNLSDEQLVNIFKNYLVQGYSKEVILKNLSTTLNIEKTEIVNIIKRYLLENGQVKQNDNGDYEIGEE